jgi:hypothetical protein
LGGIRRALKDDCPNPRRHPGEGRDLAIAFEGADEIPAFAGMTDG